MKKLKESFRRKGLLYTLIKRNECLALYGVGGTYTDKPISFEVDIIYIRSDEHGEREQIPSNEVFGRDRSRSFINKQKALDYFDELTDEIRKERILSQGVPKVVSGVEQNEKVIPEYQLA